MLGQEKESGCIYYFFLLREGGREGDRDSIQYHEASPLLQQFLLSRVTSKQTTNILGSQAQRSHLALQMTRQKSLLALIGPP